MSEPAMVIIKAGCGHFDHYELQPGERILFTSGDGNIPPTATATPERNHPYTHFSLCQSCTAVEESKRRNSA